MLAVVNNKQISRPLLLFVFLFLLAHFILFLPHFIFNADHASLFPTGDDFSLLYRANCDPFRIAGEWLLISTLLPLLPSRKWVLRLFSWLYLLFFVYQGYYAFSVRLYGQTPSLVNDHLLIQQVLPVFLSGRGWNNLWLITGVALLYLLVHLGVYWLVKKQIRALWTIPDHSFLWLFFGAIWIFLVIVQGRHGNQPQAAAQWISPRMAMSLDTRSLNGHDIRASAQRYAEYSNRPLLDPPDIYLLVIESYGTVATSSAALVPEYDRLINSLEDSLQLHGWHAASALSRAPILGGRSWLSFSTLMTGLKIENQLHYNQLLYEYPEFPHLVRYLNLQGYYTSRLSTLSATEAARKRIPQQSMQQLWGFDRWINFEDIPYTGHRYNHYGGIPDQYALSYFAKHLPRDTANFLFFITMNSHAPWTEPPPLVNNWTSLDTIHPPFQQQKVHTGLSPFALDAYARSIEYQLRFISQHIIRQARPNSIFILVGDHQPGGLQHHLPDDALRFVTPLHIIGRDSLWIDQFAKLGFAKGLQTAARPVIRIHHEDLYPLLMTQLQARYGALQKKSRIYTKGIN